ncbi:MAG: hypothetical protein ABIV06_02210 [Thermoanaerobaculia bacterium]
MNPLACRRFAWLAVFSCLLADPIRAGLDPILVDGFESGDTCLWGVGPQTCPGFTITTPPLLVGSGEEKVYCYYVHTGNSATQGVHRITSSMEGVTRYTSLFTTHDASGDPVDNQPPGTLSSSGCTFFGPDQNSRRIYTAHGLEEELLLPTDDGAGDPLAFEFLAGQPAVLVAHLFNDTPDPMTTAVTLTAYAHGPGVAYTQTASLTTTDTQLMVPPSTLATSTHTCPVPSAVKFWWFSTHTHDFAQLARIRNGSSDIVVSVDPLAPAVAAFGPPTFYEFGVGEQLTYSCDFFNDSGTTVGFGESYSVDENCIGLAYFFPATVPRYCFNNVLLP